MKIESKMGRASVGSAVFTTPFLLFFLWSPFYWGLFFENDNPGHIPWIVQCCAGFGMTAGSLIIAAVVLLLLFIVLFLLANPFWALYTYLVNGEAEWLIDA